MSHLEHDESEPQDGGTHEAADVYRHLGSPEAAHIEYPTTQITIIPPGRGDQVVADERAIPIIPDEIMREQGIQGRAIGILTVDAAEGQKGSTPSFVIIDTQTAPIQEYSWSDGGGLRQVFAEGGLIDTGKYGFILAEVITGAGEEQTAITETRPILGKPPTIITEITRTTYPIGGTQDQITPPTKIGATETGPLCTVGMGRDSKRVVVENYSRTGNTTLEQAIDTEKYEQELARTRTLIEKFNSK